MSRCCCRAQSRSGVPALALDVRTAYELRRAGFGPRRGLASASTPRILPSTLVQLLSGGTRADVAALSKMIASGKTSGGAITASANILGKNYVKQVDVVISAWDTGPELMISTKRMDSSFGKNAANRVEESYGDAKNLEAGTHKRPWFRLLPSLDGTDRRTGDYSLAR